MKIDFLSKVVIVMALGICTVMQPVSAEMTPLEPIKRGEVTTYCSGKDAWFRYFIGFNLILRQGNFDKARELKVPAHGICKNAGALARQILAFRETALSFQKGDQLSHSN